VIAIAESPRRSLMIVLAERQHQRRRAVAQIVETISRDAHPRERRP